MQYSYIETLKKIASNKPLAYIFKMIIVLIIAGYLYAIINSKEGLTWSKIVFALDESWGSNWYYFIITISLVVVNWGLEACKWMWLVRNIECISFWKAYKGVLTGLSLGIITPHSIGDYFGRVMQLERSGRGKAVGAVFASRIAQLLITLFFGCCSLFYMYLHYNTHFLALVLLIIGIVLITILVILRKGLVHLISRIPYINKGVEYINILSTYKFSNVLEALSIALGRYIIFSSQYIMLLVAYEVDLTLSILFIGVTYVFLIKSIFAINTLVGLGLREAAALYFFYELMGVGVEKVLLAGFTLWLINILLPTLIGSLFVLNIKLLNKRG